MSISRLRGDKIYEDFPGGPLVKKPPCDAGDVGGFNRWLGN